MLDGLIVRKVLLFNSSRFYPRWRIHHQSR